MAKSRHFVENYAIAQSKMEDAVHNVHRHSKSDTATIRLTRSLGVLYEKEAGSPAQIT